MPGSGLRNSGRDSANQRSLAPPAADELEVSIFGPGYGECIVLHIGNDEWVIVDSCVAGRDRPSVALEYLAALGVDPASAVKLIVATHWHDDHIRGLAEVVRSSPNARFACSVALRSPEFLTLVEATRTGLMMVSSGIDEFREVLSILHRRHARPDLMWAIKDRTLYRRGNPDGAQVLSLTPSDEAVTAALRAIARLLPDDLAPKTRIGSVDPNDASVVLWISVGPIHLLLGADLEEEQGGHWTAVLASGTRPTGKASVFKVPHHGSSNADHPDVWGDLVRPGAVTLLSPFHRGSVILPTPEDQARICSRNSETYITSKTDRPRPRRRDRTVDRTVGEVVVRISATNARTGQVRARTKIAEAGAAWDVQTISPASQLCA